MASRISLIARQWVLRPNLITRHFHRSACFQLSDNKELETAKSPSSGDHAVQTTFAEAAKENVKTAGYGAIILIGIGVTGGLLYALGSELFSTDSPTALFQSTSDTCIAHPKVQDLLGMPIKAFGEETRRGRRRHVASLKYVDSEGHPGVRIKYYLQGIRNRGIVQVDARDDGLGTLKTRFIIVTADNMLQQSVVVEDNTKK